MINWLGRQLFAAQQRVLDFQRAFLTGLTIESWVQDVARLTGMDPEEVRETLLDEFGSVIDELVRQQEFPGS
jgi:hypothetical protein